MYFHIVFVTLFYDGIFTDGRKFRSNNVFFLFPIFFVTLHVHHVTDVVLYVWQNVHILGLYERGHLHIILNTLLTTYIYGGWAPCCGNNIISRSGRSRLFLSEILVHCMVLVLKENMFRLTHMIQECVWCCFYLYTVGPYI